MSHLSNVWFKVTDLQVAHGRGCWVTTTDGEEYLDFAAGHRGQLDRPRPSAGRRCDRRAGRAVHPRPGQRLQARSARAARRQARRADAGGDRHVLLRQLRRRDHRGRGQARQAGHQAAEHDRVQRQLPRSHAHGDGDDDVEDGVPRRSRAAAGRRVRGAVPRPAGGRSGRRGRRGAHRLRPPAEDR